MQNARADRRTSSTIAPVAERHDAEAPPIAGRYTRVRLLRDARGVRTYLGRDLSTDVKVIVKTVSPAGISAIGRSRIERAGARLVSTDAGQLAPLLWAGIHDDLLAVVSPFVDGTPLEQRLASGPLDVEDALTVGRRLLRALATAHALDIVHRGVKPSNIIVDRTSPIERAVLVDVGLHRTEVLGTDPLDVLAGTAVYLSPEQAGLVDIPVDERSDVYSAGVVLYECLAGRPPFTGESVGEVLRQHLGVVAPSLRSLGADVPRSLEEVVGHMLRKEPADRYQSAEAALADLMEIASSLARGVTPQVVPGLHDRRTSLTEPAFVGRTRDLESLGGELDKARAGRGGLVLVEGESGGGKTRLLEEFANSATGAWVLHGQAVEHAAQRPLGMLEAFADDLRRAAEADPTMTDGIRDRLGGHVQAVCEVLPDLGGILERATGRALHLGPEAHGETRALNALSALLDAVGSAERPALVLLDDCQWSSDVTVRLLEQWKSNTNTDRHVMIVAAFRSEDVGADHPLRRLDSTHIDLEPLATADVRRLADSMAGHLPDEAASVVEELSGGSPFMASALVHGLVESGAIVAERDGWTVDAPALAEVRSSRRAAAFLARRLELLPQATLRLLQAAAVLGKSFDLDNARMLIGQSSREAFDALEEARRRHIVWCRRDGSSLPSFVHDKLREALLDRLPVDERSRLHREAALLLVSREPEPIFDLAYHFDRAGDADRALAYALRAAHEARTRYALDVAETQYRIAERCAAGKPDDVRARIAQGLGDVLMLRGRYRPAAAAFQSALDLERAELARATIEAKLSELAFKRGDLQSSGEIAEQALRRLGKRAPRRAFLLWVLWEVLVQARHTILPPRRASIRAERAEADFLTMRLYSRLAHAYWFVRGPVPTLWAHLRELNLAERYPPTPELAQAYSEHAPCMALVGWWARGIQFVERSLEIRTSQSDLWGQGQSLNFWGVLLYNAGRLHECLERCARAADLLERTGDQWELNIARLHKAFALYRLGNLREAAAEARRVHEVGVAIGDPQASGIALEILAKVTAGEVDEQSVARELERPTHDVQTATEVMQAEAVRLLGRQQPGEAVALLQSAVRKVRKARIWNEYVASLHPWLATALREAAEVTEPWAFRERRRLVRRAARRARIARWIARIYRNNSPHALRESALVSAMRGRPRRARRFIELSIATAQDLGARHERAQSVLVRGRIGRSFGWPGASDDLERASAELHRMRTGGRVSRPVEQPATLSLADRFDSILEAGRKITSAMSRHAVLDATIDAAVALLRGQRATIVESDSVEEGTGLSAVLCRRAFRTQRPALFGTGAAEDLIDAAAASGTRSALAAPIFVRGRATACIYVDHDEVGCLFGPDESRLAGFISSLASAALESAEGLAEVRELTRSLERRVADRTAQLTETNRALDASLRQLQEALERERDIAQRLRELDELRSDFLSTVSHELRTPLTAIAGFSETLLDKWLRVDERTRKDFVRRISTNASALDQLISELLDFSRLERGQLRIDLRPTDIKPAVQTALEKFSRTLEAHRIQVEVPDGTRVLADAGAIARVLENLLSNAAKFSPAGSTVSVTARVVDDTAVVTVQDEGIGIPREELGRIFERFYRVHRADDAARGTGIGLAIVKQFVEAQGGRVWVRSRAGEGAAFSFSLLLAPAD